MMKFLAGIFIGWALVIAPAAAQMPLSAPPDPFTIQPTFDDTGAPEPPNLTTSVLSLKSQVFNPADRKLALIVAGQSQCTNVNPSAYTPANASVIDNFNIYDGGSYSLNGSPLVGTQELPDGANTVRPGSPSARLAQLFITNNIFDHVLLVPVCIGGTAAEQWAGTSTRFNNAEKDILPVAMRRLASRGITPAGAGWSFLISWWQGEADAELGTSSASYQSSMSTIGSSVQSAGFNCATCRFFINIETWDNGIVSSTIQNAQAAVVTNNPTFFFTGGNVDTLNASNRQADNTHFNDTGAQSAAQLVYNAIHASGAPF